MSWAVRPAASAAQHGSQSRGLSNSLGFDWRGWESAFRTGTTEHA